MIIVFYLHPLIKGNFSSVCLGLLEENIFVLEKPGNINTTITRASYMSKASRNCCSCGHPDTCAAAQ